jgi:L-asparaginase
MSKLLIHTGGTIGMVQSPKGFEPALGIVETCVQDFVRDGLVTGPVDIKILEPLIDSANASPADWTRIAEIIAENHESYDGFVVTHGTDTLAYTAAALCFALEGLSKPVVVTGAMLPLTVPNSDGVRNLRDALLTVGTAPQGVWVQFAGQRLHGARTRKSHSRDYDAFRAEHTDIAPLQVAEQLTLHAFKDPKVAVLAIAPGAEMSLFKTAAETCDGLVLRCYGSGTAPNDPALKDALAVARQRGIPVLGVSQCAEGGIAFGTYAAGAVLVDNGVIDGRDMTVEAAYAKLVHALSVGDDPTERLSRCLCGEFTEA